MTSRLLNLMAFGNTNHVLVIAHEREVLVYSGQDESPLWREACSGDVVGVGCDSRFVYAVDHQQWYCWEAVSGQLQHQRPSNSPVLTMSVAANGDCALLTDTSVEIVNSSAKEKRIETASPTTAAWSDSNCELAVGQGDGELLFFKRATNKAFDQVDPGRLRLDGPIRSIAWSSAGYWAVISEAIVWRIERDGSSKRPLIKDLKSPPVLVACSQEGDLVAVSLEDSSVLVFRITPASLVASFRYQDREVTGLAFGPEPYLGIGLDTGDGNKMDLSKASGGVFRTDPHPGRPRNRWLLQALIIPSAPTSTQSTTEPTAKADTSFPGWMGPPLGVIIGGIVGAKASREIWMILGASLLGLIGGVVVWFLDRSRNHKA
jgi:hypothetical protein